ncbi:MAG: PEP-CTERM sorting domain-containing protein [Bacteroidaceae bacterium]|nr:PEP-CTERM sorting domain-containing protein [Bacteroidaceae bacterium]
MKKTIIALLSLASLSYGTTTDATFTHSTNNGQAGYVGFTFSLNDTWLTLSPAQTEEYTAFELTSITLQGAETWYRLDNANNDSGLVILNSSNTVVGKSNWDPTIGTATTVTINGKNSNSYPITYSFLTSTTVDGTSTTSSSLTLNLNESYTVLIYGNKGTFDSLTVNESKVTSITGTSSGTATPTSIATAGLRVDYNATYTNGVMIDKDGNAAVTAFPVVSFSGKLVPEPTTATLSLLALAGLAARRRRASR